jgi:hypothetical protein
MAVSDVDFAFAASAAVAVARLAVAVALAEVAAWVDCTDFRWLADSSERYDRARIRWRVPTDPCLAKRIGSALSSVKVS